MRWMKKTEKEIFCKLFSWKIISSQGFESLIKYFNVKFQIYMKKLKLFENINYGEKSFLNNFKPFHLSLNNFLFKNVATKSAALC